MKLLKLLSLFLCLTFLFADCKKEDFTGTLKIQFSSASNNYEDVFIYIYSLENNSYSLHRDKPDSKGQYSRKLLQGNYRVNISHRGGQATPSFQLIAGETYELKYNIQ